jgi:transposase
MGKVKSWEVSDSFWELVAPLIPPPPGRKEGVQYKRKRGGGRKPITPRKIFEAIVFVLRTGCQWKSLSKEQFGSASSVHKYFSHWIRAGLFINLWQEGLAEFDELEGIAWKWQSIDGSMIKAPLAQEAVGRNPTDRGKKRKQSASIGRRAWNPAIHRRNRGKSP